MHEVGLPQRHCRGGYTKADIGDLVEGAMKQQRPLSTAPRPVSEVDLVAIFERSAELSYAYEGKDRPMMEMVGFGYKTAWLAIRDGDIDQVFGKLDATPVKPVDWRVGLDRAYVSDDLLVATPLLAGWRLVTGRWLLLRESRVDPVGLSERLDTEVQFFATDRVSEYHRWTRAVKGILVRSFAHLGETGQTLVWLGDPDGAERTVGLPEALSEPGSDDIDDDHSHSVLIGEQDVMRVAAAWSIDPTSLDALPAPGPLTLARLS